MVHLGSIYLPVMFVSDDDRMSAEHEVWFGLHQTIGEFISDFTCVFFIEAIVNATVGNEAMIFKIKTIPSHQSTNRGC